MKKGRCGGDGRGFECDFRGWDGVEVGLNGGGRLGGVENQMIVKRASLWERVFLQVVDNQWRRRSLVYQGVRRRGARRDWKAGGRNE